MMLPIAESEQFTIVNTTPVFLKILRGLFLIFVAVMRRKLFSVLTNPVTSTPSTVRQEECKMSLWKKILPIREKIY